MLKNKKIIAIIPARGGSKGLPGKNIKKLLGKPLIAWTIEAALKSRYLDKVIVSTEDKKIAEIAKKCGGQVIKRPKSLAEDNSSIYGVIFHAIDWFAKKGLDFDIIVLLEPTSPLRKDKDIDSALELFLKNYEKADSLVSVGEIRLENPYLALNIKGKYIQPLLKIDFPQRQKLQKAYFPYGAIYLSKIGALKKHWTFYQKKTMPYFLERWQGYEIDDIYDFLCVETVLRKITK